MAAKKFVFDPEKDECGDGNNNAKRANNAEAGLSASLKARGDPPRIDEDAVCDLLADLFHYCDREGLPVHALVRCAKNSWKAER